MAGAFTVVHNEYSAWLNEGRVFEYFIKHYLPYWLLFIPLMQNAAGPDQKIGNA
jgi:hypothetical protein